MLKMQFWGDAAAELFRRKIERSMKVNCKNVRLITIFTSRPLISTQVKDRISVLATPNVVYRFKCGMCHSTYIGYTERRLEDRVKEHVPRWALNGLGKVSRSSVTDHIINEGHRCTRETSFEILYRARNRRMLKFVEATSIRLLVPDLNIQKEFDYQLKLPWM